MPRLKSALIDKGLKRIGESRVERGCAGGGVGVGHGGEVVYGEYGSIPSGWRRFIVPSTVAHGMDCL